MTPAIPGFTDDLALVNGQTIAYSKGGSGPPLLLLHGFPQTRAMWAKIAPVLAKHFTVIAADLRGYGASSKPPDVEDYSFRDMAADQQALMTHIGHSHFHLVGHDRGARTAHRLTLDHPQAVTSLTLMDIVPTHHLLNDLPFKVAQAYYHWFFLAQPEPFPEQMILADPEAYFQSCLLGWGAAQTQDFDPEQLTAYRTAWHDPDTVRGMCNDYRATLAVDFDHDIADLAQQVTCPALVLFGADGAMARAYDVAQTWGPRLTQMQAHAIPGGHFFPDTAPAETTRAVRDFLQKQPG